MGKDAYVRVLFVAWYAGREHLGQVPGESATSGGVWCGLRGAGECEKLRTREACVEQGRPEDMEGGARGVWDAGVVTRGRVKYAARD